MSRFILITVVALGAATFTGCTGAKRVTASQSIPYYSLSAVEHADPAQREVVVENASVIMDPVVPPKELVDTHLVVSVKDAGALANMLVGRPGSRAHNVETAQVSLPAKLDLEFTGKITNNGENAIRFEKAAITVSVDGTLVNLDQKKYKAFKGVVVPGKSTITVSLPGPHVEKIKDGSVIRLTINDMTANRKLVNCQWTFNAKVEVKQAAVKMMKQRRDLYPAEVADLQRQALRDQATLSLSIDKLNTGRAQAAIK